MHNPIVIQTTVNAPIEKVWAYWTQPEHINGWAFASDDWQAQAELNELKVGGKFKTIMSAKDGSMSFPFTGVYTNITENELISYTLDDGRQVSIEFTPTDDGVKITQKFEAETQNARDMQQQGWQAFLDNFKKYTEGVS